MVTMHSTVLWGAKRPVECIWTKLREVFFVKAVLTNFPFYWASLVTQTVKNLPSMKETLVWFLGQEDPLELATHSSILAWRIPWTEAPGGLQRVGHEQSDWAQAQTREQTPAGYFSLFLHSQTGEGNSSTEKICLSPGLDAKIRSHSQRLKDLHE